jgi:hypothetical protein
MMMMMMSFICLALRVRRRKDAQTKQGALPLSSKQPHLEGVLFDGAHVVDLVLRSLGHDRTESFSRVPYRLAERRAGDGVRRECASKVTGAESTGDSQCVVAMRKGAASRDCGSPGVQSHPSHRVSIERAGLAQAGRVGATHARMMVIAIQMP